jgi:2-oxoglutarate dehydrogenase E1 component
MEHASMREILDALRRTYCDTIGVEYLHLSDPSEKAWIQGRIENIHNRTDFTLKGKKAILQRLAAAELFERYLHKNIREPSVSELTAARPLFRQLSR